MNGANEGEAQKTTEEETKIEQSNANAGEEGQVEIKDRNSGVGESCFAMIQFEKGEQLHLKSKNGLYMAVQKIAQ